MISFLKLHIVKIIILRRAVKMIPNILRRFLLRRNDKQDHLPPERYLLNLIFFDPSVQSGSGQSQFICCFTDITTIFYQRFFDCRFFYFR
jgi:hypothetical protein